MPDDRRARRVRPKPAPTRVSRKNAQGEATRELILVTAEEMFAEHGIAAVPLRDIGLAAGQRNNVAVQYHFGDRETLLSAIVDYRVATTDDSRSAMLADLVHEGRPTVQSLVAAFVVPLAAHFEDGNHYLAFLSRYVVERAGYTGLEVHHGQAVVTIREMIRRLVPDCPPVAFEERWLQTMTTTVHTLARYQRLLKDGSLPAPVDELIDDLVVCLSAAIESPTPAALRPSVVSLASVQGQRPRTGRRSRGSAS